MKWIIPALGAIGILLGGLWLLQGLGFVQVQPILCVGDCAPIEGSSPTWTIIGLLVVAVSGLAIFYSLKRNRSSSRGPT